MYLVKNKLAFSVIELLVIITIIGIIAGIAAPTYNDYMLRTKIETMRTIAAGAELAVQNDYFNYNKSFNFSNYANSSTSFTKSKADFVTSIAVTKGIITITGNAAKLNNKAINLTFTPTVAADGSITWTCSCDPSFYKYAPPECKN